MQLELMISDFYTEYHGHRIGDLKLLHDFIRRAKGDDHGIIFLAGDSTLDNKHWFSDSGPAVNGYEQVLDPPVSVKDVAYWLNVEAVNRGVGERYTALNCAVEESTIQGRAFGNLLPADKFVREHVRPNDVVVVSVGGNDVALKPTPCTIASILALLFCAPKRCIKEAACGVPLPCDDYCCGCGAGCLSNALACPLGYGYFLHLFSTRLQILASRLVGGGDKPKKILICMIYFLDEAPGNSWADATLSALGYNRDPEKLQLLIQSIFQQASPRVKISGTEVVAVPLFTVLDGKRSEEYVQRVEPSAVGGSKIASLLMDAILGVPLAPVPQQEKMSL